MTRVVFVLNNLEIVNKTLFNSTNDFSCNLCMSFMSIVPTFKSDCIDTLKLAIPKPSHQSIILAKISQNFSIK